MRKIKWLSFIFLLSVSNISLAQWELRNNGISESHQTGSAIDAADSNFVVVAYQNRIYKTENAGIDWFNITPPNDSGFVDVSVIEHSHFWVCTENGKILATTDGGIIWNVQFYDIQKTKFMNYIKMFNLNNGIAMGDAADDNSPVLFLRTTNSGINWFPVNNDFLKGTFSSDLWRKVDFPDVDNGYYSPYGGLDFPQTYKTIDGGQSWNPTNKGVAPELIKFYNKDIGFIISYAGVKGIGVIRTFDGLNTVDTIVKSKSDDSPSDVEFIPGDPSKIFYLDYGRLFLSKDSGKTWQGVSDSSEFLLGRDIVLTDQNHGWLLCDTGKVYYSSNICTITNIKNETNNLPDNFVLVQNYPNPFNPSTVINYSIKYPGLVKIRVYDILGSEVAKLVNETKDSGKYSVEFYAYNLPSGVYIYTLQVNGFSASRKMLLLK